MTLGRTDGGGKDKPVILTPTLDAVVDLMARLVAEKAGGRRQTGSRSPPTIPSPTGLHR